MSLDLSKPLKDRDQDITYMRFRSTVDCYAVDNRITIAGSLSTHFSIRLPNHFFDSSDDSVTLISPVDSIPGPNNTRTAIARTLFATPGISATSTPATPTSTTSTLPFKSPKMGFLSTNSSSSSSTIRRGYYGSFKFLDNDDKFLTTFGNNPILLHGYPVSCDKKEVGDRLSNG